MGERGEIICPNCGDKELCCWPWMDHDHRCDKDLAQYPFHPDLGINGNVIDVWEMP